MTMRRVLLAVACLPGFLLAPVRAGDGLAPTSFADRAAAERAWTPMAGTPAVGIDTPADKQSVGYIGDPTMLKDRASYDYDLPTPFGRATRVRLWVYCDRPDAFSSGTFYLHSGDGWYSASVPIRKGWQPVKIDLGDFRPSGRAGPIAQADRIRISFWRAENPPAGLARALVREIRAETPPVVLVGPSAAHARTSAGRSALRYTQRVGDLLALLGLDPPMLDESRLTIESLGSAKVAVFPLSGELPAGSRKAVEQFVADGGKLIVCYTARAPLAGLLGLRKTEWTSEPREGAFATISYALSANGARRKIRQHSWCATRITPGDTSRIVGRWSDGSPAIAAGPGGWFIGHVLTAGDDLNKAGLLAAALGDLSPELGAHVATEAIRAAWDDKLRSMEVRAYRDRRRLSPERNEQINKRLTTAGKARNATDPGWAEAVTIRNAAEEIGCLAVPAWDTPYRAMWCHSAFGLPDRDWSKAAELLADNGVKMLVVNVSSGGLAYYPSTVLARSPKVAETGDPVAACLAACRREGIGVHAWRVCWNTSAGPKAFVDRMKSAGRVQVSRAGKVGGWLAPHVDANFELERSAFAELLQRYVFDGVHLDYIRYPDAAHDYSASARRAFESASGRTVRRWPADVLAGGSLAEAFGDWRREQITRLVRAVTTDAKKLRPGTQVSAAVFRDWPKVRDSVGQDVEAWMKDGLLQFVCPMDYTADDEAFARMIAEQRKRTPAGVKLLAGIGVTIGQRVLPASQVAKQIDLARAAGADGFVLFNLTPAVADEILPRLRLGPLAED